MSYLLRTLVVVGILHTYLSLSAAHIIGGEITYECLGWTNGDSTTNSRTYQFKLNIYRDCQGNGARFDSQPGAPFTASVTIYLDGNPVPFELISLGQPTISFIDPNPGNPCLIVPANVCVEQGEYIFPAIDLPVSDKSYFITYQRCCRNNTITNIQSPGASGATYFMELTPAAQAECNNSPVYNDFPPVVICAGEPFTFDHSATDADGDQLVYEFCSPFLGGGLNMSDDFAFDGVAPNPDAPPPYETVTFIAPFYTALDPLGTTADINIGPNSGIITGTPQSQGQFVVGVCVKEFRNGELLSIVRRDFQFNVTTCDPTVQADIREDRQLADGTFLLSRCGQTRVNFLNQSFQQSFIDDYFWSFELEPGRDTIVNTWNAIVDFPGPGEYRGALYLNPGTDCSDTAEIVVQLFPGITADFSYDYDTCVAGPVLFEDLSVSGAGQIEDWDWDFGDGKGDVVKSPAHTYLQPGDQQASLRVIDINGCEDSTSQAIRYFPVPGLIIVSPSSFTGCAPAPISFSNLSAPINQDYEILWDFGDNKTAAAISPEHLYEKEGTYSVSLEIISPIGCQTDTVFPNLITIEPSPEAAFSFAPRQPDNFNPEVAFTDESSGAVRWFWDFEGVAYSIDQNPTYTFRDTGRQDIRLVVTHPSGCLDTVVQEIDIIPRTTYFLPNAFTPNDDSINDVYLGKGYLEGASRFEMTIWNRWGEQIFRSDDPRLGWNGRKNNTGGPAPSGTYMCLVTYTGPRGEVIEIKGAANLIR